MKRALVAAVLAVVAVATVDVLGDLTQTRPDPPQPGSTMEVVFEVRTRDPRRAPLHAAQALWGACQGTIVRSVDATDVEVVGRRARVVVEPALGEHAQDRLRGCLSDLSVDRTKARVLAMRRL